MSKEKTKIYDFSKVMVEIEFDKYREIDVSKTVGNVIHQNTGDIGLDEVARCIYKTGKAEIQEPHLQEIVAILRDPKTPVLAAVKRSVIDILTSKKD